MPPTTPTANPFAVLATIELPAQVAFLASFSAEAKRTLRLACKAAQALFDGHVGSVSICSTRFGNSQDIDLAAAMGRISRNMPNCAAVMVVLCGEHEKRCAESVLGLAQQQPLPAVRDFSLFGSRPLSQPHAAALACALPNLEELELYFVTEWPGIIASLATLPRLRSLTIPSSLYDDAAIGQLQGLTNLDLTVGGFGRGPAVGLRLASSGRPAALGLFSCHPPATSPPHGLHSLAGLRQLAATAVVLPAPDPAGTPDGASPPLIALPPGLCVLRLYGNLAQSGYRYIHELEGWMILHRPQRSLELPCEVDSPVGLASVVRFFSAVAGVRQITVKRLLFNPVGEPAVPAGGAAAAQQQQQQQQLQQQLSSALAYLQGFASSSGSASGSGGSGGAGEQQRQQQHELVVHSAAIMLGQDQELQQLLAFLREVAVVVKRVELRTSLPAAAEREMAGRARAELLATGRVREVVLKYECGGPAGRE